MSDRDKTVLLWLAAVAIFATVIVYIVTSEPECPAGASAKLTRSGWYCVVPAIPPHSP